MRASKAKELRKAAKTMALEVENSYVILPGEPKTIRLAKTCFRGVYKILKKKYKVK